jgi:DNA-binding CsgD family transcriptional regulator
MPDNNNSEAAERLILEIHSEPLDDGRLHDIVDTICEISGADGADLVCRIRLSDEVPVRVTRGLVPPGPLKHVMSASLETDQSTDESQEDCRVTVLNPRALEAAFPLRTTKRGTLHAFLTLFRSERVEPFTDRDEILMRRVAAHLRLAIKKYLMIPEVQLRAHCLATALDAVAMPLFIVGSTGEMLYCNRAGVAWKQEGETLQMDTGQQIPGSWLQERTVCAEVLNAIKGRKSGCARVTASKSGRRLVLSIVPLPASGTAPAGFGLEAGLVWLAPLESPPSTALRIKNLFTLTAAEDTLLKTFSTNWDLALTAAVLDISIHTARSHLKAIQRKTGCRSQAALAQLLERLGVIESHSTA